MHPNIYYPVDLFLFSSWVIFQDGTHLVDWVVDVDDAYLILKFNVSCCQGFRYQPGSNASTTYEHFIIALTSFE